MTIEREALNQNYCFHAINSTGRHIIETVSELIYTPKNEREYGTLACWAKNLIGRQTEPCLFQVVPAGNFIFLLFLSFFSFMLFFGFRFIGLVQKIDIISRQKFIFEVISESVKLL